MRFSSSFRSKVQDFLKNDFSLFLDASKDHLKLNLGNYHRVCFENIAIKQPPFDFESCIFFLENIHTSLDIYLERKFHLGSQWKVNDIIFPFIADMPSVPEFGTAAFFAYRESRDNLEYKCETEFWETDEKKKEYDKYLDVNIFNDNIFFTEELSKYQSSYKFLINSTVWLDYVKSLVEQMFTKFKYSSKYSTKKMHRYLIELEEKIYFGFEYSDSEIRHLLNGGIPTLPDYFNLILIDSQSFKKSENVLDYYYMENDSIISLGILGNPFFYYPCYPLDGFSAIDTHRQTQQGKSYVRKIHPLENGQYQLIHPKEYGSAMKKHAFFYMDLLSSTSKSYLEYLENVIIKSLNC